MNFQIQKLKQNIFGAELMNWTFFEYIDAVP